MSNIWVNKLLSKQGSMSRVILDQSQVEIHKIIIDKWQDTTIRILFNETGANAVAVMVVVEVTTTDTFKELRKYHARLYPNSKLILTENVNRYLLTKCEDIADDVLDIYEVPYAI